MNQFLQSNQQKVSDYLQEVGVMIHGATSLPQRQMVNEVERRAAFDVVHRLAHQHLTQIDARARVLFPTEELVARQFAGFSSALSQLGAPPPAPSQLSTSQSSIPTQTSSKTDENTFFGKLLQRDSSKRQQRDAAALFYAIEVGDDVTA
eukprot:CAMPEP_0168580672 /NCGR_PEP_ID=MMETSP0420-20121227/942_1 /TAXON_ID=498008 /ORGANISM="Pessonella sp." /LENGTH=148 /DNA_ID=CAMNT_0008614845 /DNA_START=869 /DNA_END=1312 /DNA_ORIENTATION=-